MPEDINENSLIRIKLPDSIDNAVKNLTDKPTATIGETLSNCFFLVFGDINQKAEMKRAKYAANLKQFKDELESKINAVPEEKRTEPNLHTICTALDNMRYCVEEKELRSMFSTLIANSINQDKVGIVHPAFGELIKQMTSLDATILVFIHNQPTMPVIRILEKLNTGGEKRISQNLVWNSWTGTNAVASSLDNLCRLKLIELSYQEAYADRDCK